MKKETARPRQSGAGAGASAVEEYLQRAELERCRHFDKRKPGPKPVHVGKIIWRLMHAIHEDRGERRKNQGG